MAASDNKTLCLAVEKLIERAKKYRGKRLGEQNTKASLIEPMLEALGWDIRDPDEVHREFRPKSQDSPVDFALKILRKPRLFLEAKGLGENLSDRKWVAQVVAYSAVAGVEWCVLSDGDQYRLYNATAAVDADEKLFCTVHLSTSKTEDIIEMLSLISRKNMEESRLNILWSAHFIDRRVKAAIDSLLESPDDAFIKLLQRSVKDLTQEQIIDAIRRLDIEISPPLSLTEPAAVLEALPAAVLVQAPKLPKKLSSPSAGALSRFLAQGLLKPQQTMFAQYKGQKLHATVEADGTIKFDDKIYNSTSASGIAAINSISPGRPSVNGWIFWHIQTGSGELIPLSVIRAKLK